jgi:membrane associated rhomboid family serine protease
MATVSILQDIVLRNRASDEFHPVRAVLQDFFRAAGTCSLRSSMNLALARGRLFIQTMFGVTTSDDYRPVTWMGRYPVDVTTMLVGVHVVCAILTAFLFAIGHAGILNYAMFDSAAVLHGQVWRFFTYAFIHQPFGYALLLFAIEMYMLFFFGREVERFIGRRAYIWLYALLLVVPALILEVWGLLKTRTGFSGSGALHFAVFAAFVTLYPNVQFFLRIPAKWVFVIFAAIATLSGLAAHDWQDLLVLWASIALAFSFIELRGAGPELAWVSDFKARFRPKPKLYVVQKSSARSVEPDDVYASIDPILDKISKSGMGSLTEIERKILDRARNRLLKKE